MEAEELFEKYFDEFIVRFEVSQKSTHAADLILWNRLMGDDWLLDWDDPERRVESFFLKVEMDINQYVLRYGQERRHY